MNFDKFPHHVLQMTAIGLLISSLWTDHDLNQKFSNLNLLPLILRSSSRVISHTSFSLPYKWLLHSLSLRPLLMRESPCWCKLTILCLSNCVSFGFFHIINKRHGNTASNWQTCKSTKRYNLKRTSLQRFIPWVRCLFCALVISRWLSGLTNKRSSSENGQVRGLGWKLKST